MRQSEITGEREAVAGREGHGPDGRNVAGLQPRIDVPDPTPLLRREIDQGVSRPFRRAIDPNHPFPVIIRHRRQTHSAAWIGGGQRVPDLLIAGAVESVAFGVADENGCPRQSVADGIEQKTFRVRFRKGVPPFSTIKRDLVDAVGRCVLVADQQRSLGAAEAEQSGNLDQRLLAADLRPMSGPAFQAPTLRGSVVIGFGQKRSVRTDGVAPRRRETVRDVRDDAAVQIYLEQGRASAVGDEVHAGGEGVGPPADHAGLRIPQDHVQIVVRLRSDEIEKRALDALGYIEVRRQEVLAAAAENVVDQTGLRRRYQEMMVPSPSDVADLLSPGVQRGDDLAVSDLLDHDPALITVGDQQREVGSVGRNPHRIDRRQATIDVEGRGLGADAEPQQATDQNSGLHPLLPNVSLQPISPAPSCRRPACGGSVGCGFPGISLA